MSKKIYCQFAMVAAVCAVSILMLSYSSAKRSAPVDENVCCTDPANCPRPASQVWENFARELIFLPY
jgi:hypothetical protein